MDGARSRTRARRGQVRRHRRALATGLLLLATALGGVRAFALAEAAGQDPATLQIDGATLRVTGVEQVVGTAAADLMGGMAHNISGYVPQDEMMLSVSVEITAGAQPSTYEARRIVARAVGARTPLMAAGGSLGSGFLDAHGRVVGTVTFVVPRNGSHLVLSVRGSPRSIDLAAVDQVAPGHEGHDHGTTTR
ncbi:hypothetical protein [Nocardioides pocheonensis]|uniref:DUF4352 domain-containing protein n=1 Tax=Nocardioides pocheonensis TaxID=661485 RepID=A0A3N0GJP8_9ACTN|nr:hypothetical protein [Nocardioides pocheonensis]RNM12669.1 hypothetical protein EFL26_18880 [Nocardioides pocheonensis]